MKRLLAILLVIMICAAVLTACGESKSTGSDNSDITVEEQTIFDEQGIKAVVKGYGKFENEMLSLDHVLLIDVTNSTDKDISFGLSLCSINGYMIKSSYYYTIEAGKTDTYPAVFEESALESAGITTIADYEFCIVVQDNETYETLIESEPVSVRTSAYDGFEFKYDESGTVLYDTDGIRIIAKDQVDDEYLGPCVNIYVANDTDKNIGVSAVSGSVNGKEVQDLYFNPEIFAGKHSIDPLSIGEEERPEKIKSLTLSFSIYDLDTGDTIAEKTDPADVSF